MLPRRNFFAVFFARNGGYILRSKKENQKG